MRSTSLRCSPKDLTKNAAENTAGDCTRVPAAALDLDDSLQEHGHASVLLAMAQTQEYSSGFPRGPSYLDVPADLP